MALNPFTFYEGATKQSVTGVDTTVTESGKVFPVDTTPLQNNNNGLDSVILNIKITNIVPDPVTATAAGWRIRCVVESQGEGNPAWFLPVGSMFESHAPASPEDRHVIIVQPNIFNIDEGVPLDLFDGAGNITRISRQQGIIATDFRVITEVSDQFAGTADALQSFDLELFGEYYDHV